MKERLAASVVAFLCLCLLVPSISLVPCLAQGTVFAQGDDAEDSEKKEEGQESKEPETADDGKRVDDAQSPTGTGSSPSQTNTTSEPVDKAEAKTVEEVVTKALDAVGGAAALRKIASRSTIVARLVPAGQKASGTGYTYRKFRTGEKWRVDLEAPAESKAGPAKQILAFNGLAGWQSTGGAIEDLNPTRLGQLNDDNERQPTLLAGWEKDEHKFKLAGVTTFHQVPAYAVEVTGSGEPTTIYIDKRNYQVVGISYKTRSEEADATRKIDVEYSEYRPASGTIYPFKQTKYINGESASELFVSSVSTSAAIEPDLFDRPNSAGKVRLVKAIVVPFDYEQKEILVKGRIDNGEELVFLFDTGASETIIDRRIAAEHYLLKEGMSPMMAAGGRVEVSDTTLKRLELGSLILNDVTASIHPLAAQSKQLGRRIAGIIGTNVIKNFVVRIDYGKPTLTFYDSDSFERPKAAVAVPLAQQNAPVVRIKLGGAAGQEVLMLADTGAAFNNLPFAVAKRQLQRSSMPTTHITEGTGLDGKPIRLGNVVVRTVMIGTQVVNDVNFTYFVEPDEPAKKPGTEPAKGHDTSIESEGGFFRNSRIGILGNPFFQNFIVSVDYKFQRLLLEPNPMVRIRDQINANLDVGDTKLVVYRDYRAAEAAYQKGLMIASNNKDARNEALLWGRMANMRRMMAKELGRPEHAKTAYENFLKAQEMARKLGAQDVQGRILADWSLLYSDNGQAIEAKNTINQAIQLAPQDAQVNVDYATHLYRQNQFPQAQKYVEKALFLEPSNWQALWYQFKLCERFSDIPKAMLTLKEIVRYYPWSKLATSKLAGYQMLMGQQPKSVNPSGNATNPANPAQNVKPPAVTR